MDEFAVAPFAASRGTRIAVVGEFNLPISDPAEQGFGVAFGLIQSLQRLDATTVQKSEVASVLLDWDASDLLQQRVIQVGSRSF